MRKSRQLLIVALVVSVFASCVTMKDPWIGQTTAQLQEQLGGPGSKAKDGKGGEIWVYTTNVRKWTTDAASHGTSGALVEYWQIDQYFIGADGVIYDHRESIR